jgi:hypothetical protein
MHIRKYLVAAVVAAVLSSGTSAWAIAITNTSDVNTLLIALLGGGGAGIDLSSVTATLNNHTNGAGAVSSGTYTNASGTYGIGPGIVLSTGNAEDYSDGPNTEVGKTTDYFAFATPAQDTLLDPITGDLDHWDVTDFTLNFDMEPGFTEIFFNVTFGSEEYDEFVGSSFIDGFGLYVNGTNIAFVNGDPVNINHPDFEFTTGTELNGVLNGSQGDFGPYVHTFSSLVNPTGNTMTFIIGDTDDSVVDSTVYLSQLGGSPPTIPEPATVTLLVLGLGGVAWSRRRANR